MKRTLPQLLRFISVHNRTTPDEFFTLKGIRLLILRNEGRIHPHHKDAEIERAKLWNVEGAVWLEIERWGVESHQIEIKRMFIDSAEKLRTRIFSFNLNEQSMTLFEEAANEGLSIPDPILERLLQSEVSTRVVETLENIGVDKAPHPKGGVVLPDGKHEPFVYFNYPSVIHTLLRFAERLEGAESYLSILEEEKEGTLAKNHYMLRHNPEAGGYMPVRRSEEPLFNTHTTVEMPHPLDLANKAPRYIPLETLLTLLEEQMLWANWLSRTRPSAIDAVDLARYIHKSSDYQEIFHYLRKDQLRDWEQAVHAACRENLLALLLSAATVPDLNEKISAKMIRHQLGHSLFRVFYKGGLVNQVLFKYAWLFGWSDPFPNLTADQIIADAIP